MKEGHMKSTLLAVMLASTFTLPTFAQDKKEADPNAAIDPCKKSQAMAIYARQLEEMGVDEIEKIIEDDLQKKEDDAKSKRLAELLVKANKIGKVQIKDCRELKVDGQSEEAKKIMSQIEEFCKEAPKNFWAELSADGSLRFSIEGGNNSGVKSMTIGGGSDFNIAYRGQEIKFGGNISRAAVSNSEGETEAFKYDAKVDYSIDLGISNLESFIAWDTDYEYSKAQGADGVQTSKLNRHTIAAGARLEAIKTDKVELDVGLGGGATYKRVGGTLSTEQLGIWTPTIVGTMDIKVKPTDNLTLYGSTKVQKDFHPTNPAWIAAQSLGFDVKTGPVSLGLKGEVSYDTNRSIAGVDPLGYTGMFTVGVSLGELFGNKEKREAAKKARAREQSIWTNAAKYAEEMQ
jgi:hypothetical protein